MCVFILIENTLIISIKVWESLSDKNWGRLTKIYTRTDPEEPHTLKLQPPRKQIILSYFNYYHKALHLGCCSSPRFASGNKSYNLRNFQEFLTERKRTVHYGLETLSYRSPQLWSLLPENIKEAKSLEIFKRKVKNWICDNCPCRLCKPYLQNIGFL